MLRAVAAEREAQLRFEAAQAGGADWSSAVKADAAAVRAMGKGEELLR